MTSTLPVIEAAPRSRARRLAAPMGAAAVVALATLALRVRDPHVAGSWGLCPTKVLTGGDCPFCGGLRATNDLTHGDVAAAASSNLLFVLSIPLLVLAWFAWVRRADRGETWHPGTRDRVWGVVALAVLVAFTVVRNLPGSWLAS